MNSPDENFADLHLELPSTPTPIAAYKTCLVVNNLVFTSGHGPFLPSGGMTTGKIGSEVDLEKGIKAAEQTGLAILSTLKASFGSFNKIKRVVKLLGMVNCTDDFKDHAKVIDGCSLLFAKIWGFENGTGVRSAVGMNSLPSNISVEIEAIFEIE